jgi:hypothetical protein
MLQTIFSCKSALSTADCPCFRRAHALPDKKAQNICFSAAVLLDGLRVGRQHVPTIGAARRYPKSGTVPFLTTSSGFYR